MAFKAGNRKGIQSRLIRVFAVQATIVSLATGLGVFAAYKIAADVLVKQALAGEAEHFWRLVDDRGDFPLPNTNNMQGYRASVHNLEALPAPLRQLSPGYGPVKFGHKSPLVHVSEHNGQRLYLLFKEEQVSNLSIFFGVAPLTLVLILIYMASWFTFRQSQRVISPVVKLATVVENADVSNGDDLALELAPYHSIDADIDALATALEHFTRRLEAFVERERSFTRDASHELRTPLAVIKGSVDVLLQQENFSATGMVVLQRIRSTIHDMEGLIETLLLLAREEETSSVTDQQSGRDDSASLTIDPVVINDLMPELISQVKKALSKEGADMVIRERRLLEVLAPQRVLSILFINLLRNSLIHGEGMVEIVIDIDEVTVRDHGPGMDSEQMQQAFQPFFRVSDDESGHGLGLTIVKRLCDRFSWKLNVYSSPGAGTAITVKFPTKDRGH